MTDKVTVSRELLRQAIEALIEARSLLYDGRKQDRAASALRTALEQPEVEQQLMRLLASAWFYGGWKAETNNEKDMETLMIAAGWWPFKDEDALLAKIAAPQAQQPAVEPIPQAMQTLIAAMQADPEYAWSWHCNIAMAYVDAGGDHYTGNQGAARFMKLLANVDPAHELPAPQAQQFQLLTDQEIMEADCVSLDQTDYEIDINEKSVICFARAIEQAVRQKAGIK